MQPIAEVRTNFADKIFIISEPKSIEAVREMYIARYPNNKIGVEEPYSMRPL